MNDRSNELNGLTRRAFLGRVALLGSATVLGGCQQPAPTASPTATGGASGAGGAPRSAQSEAWEQLVEAAKREGEVTVYTGVIGAQARAALADSFEKSYPTIKLELVAAPSNQLIPRLVAERTAGRYIPDVLVGGGGSIIPTFKPDGGLAPLRPALLLPEVVDESAWLNRHLWLMDAAEPDTTIGFQGQVQPVITHNTQQVNVNEFTSYWDLLNPKWKGKIVARDVRTTFGGAQVVFQYRHPEMGPTFVERFWSEMDVTPSVDLRQMIDWIAQGQYLIGFSVGALQVAEATAQGLPIALVPPSRFKEGADLSSAGGTVQLFAQAPHPNAAKLYVNWLLSREGQIAWQENTLTPSLRQDIPKDGLDPMLLPDPARTYTNSSVQDYDRIFESEIAPIITRGIERS